MNERMAQELRLLRTRFPNLDYRDDGQWVLLPGWRVPTTLWDHKHIDICFQIPGGYPGQKPYGFYVSPRIALRDGRHPNNFTDSGEPPFAGEWRKFSWDAPEWRATVDLSTGCNLLNWVFTFDHRFAEGA